MNTINQQLQQNKNENIIPNVVQVYDMYPNRIKRATTKHNSKEQNQQEHNQRFAEEVYHFVDDELKYIVYERKESLLSSIRALMEYQTFHKVENYKEDFRTYFQQASRIEESKIRLILNPNLEAYHPFRNISNQKIEQLLYYKKPSHRDQNSVDQWGNQYSVNGSPILALPSVFKYNQKNNIYELEGQLSKQISSFPQRGFFEAEIQNLVNHISPHLKQVHDTFKERTYDNMLFHDTKYYVNFDREIHALISITEITISPQNFYQGPLHTEGNSTESVLYSYLYIPQQNKQLSEAQITFECNQQNIQQKTIINNMPMMQQIEFAKSDSSISLGKTTLEEDLMIIFPNCNKHQVSFRNSTDQILTRMVVTIQVVNHIDQPFSVNDYNLVFNHRDYNNNNFAYRQKKGLLNHNTHMNLQVYLNNKLID